MSLDQMILCSKLKNGLCRIVTKSHVVTKSRLPCTYYKSTVQSRFNVIKGPEHLAHGFGDPGRS